MLICLIPTVILAGTAMIAMSPDLLGVELGLAILGLGIAAAGLGAVFLMPVRYFVLRGEGHAWLKFRNRAYYRVLVAAFASPFRDGPRQNDMQFIPIPRSPLASGEVEASEEQEPRGDKSGDS